MSGIQRATAPPACSVVDLLVTAASGRWFRLDPQPPSADLLGPLIVVPQPPALQLECSEGVCDGTTYFDSDGSTFDLWRTYPQGFWSFKCRHCKRTRKTYALEFSRDAQGIVLALKYGEWPALGSRIPARVIGLLGPDRDMFLKGRRCEDQGLGIAAFSYYRRVVERQRERIIDELLRVAKSSNDAQAVIDSLVAARAQSSFSRAVESIKPALPESMLIKGHNPLTLLHRALSAGLHEESDADCLDSARAVRKILFELADRIDVALKDDAELNASLAKLMKPKGASKP